MCVCVLFSFSYYIQRDMVVQSPYFVALGPETFLSIYPIVGIIPCCELW